MRQEKSFADEFKSQNYVAQIQLFWGLMQIEKVVMESHDASREGVKLISRKNLSFVNEVDIENLNPRKFILYKQLVCLCKMYNDSVGDPEM